MELRDFLSIATILISSLLITLVLLQVRGTGFGAALGGQDASFRTRRGMQRSMHRLTILVVIVFIGISAWSVAAS
ncbi:MAG: preprotein translocase subunit SecG [Dehalococcoidia bacterium]|nr:preprotein translocase subunit SecG [Dehalococcoidia bacterium]MCA9851132.1 preprotein translocase subunit SecG [Dehalococcoidia bacterium]MCA9857383.1 preprotein translocase subunit SecG [Dehalococcoidia bacterium]MCB9491655.1 preprotein translocase subunit SecG [Dehalococcoidia bacterium]